MPSARGGMGVVRMGGPRGPVSCASGPIARGGRAGARNSNSPVPARALASLRGMNCGFQTRLWLTGAGGLLLLGAVLLTRGSDPPGCHLGPLAPDLRDLEVPAPAVPDEVEPGWAERASSP